MLMQNRGIISIILIILTILIYKKSRKTILIKIISIMLFVLIIILSSLRIENFFICYSSLETAFNNSGISGDIIKTVDSDKSTLIIYTNNKSMGTFLIYKDNNNWKIPVFGNDIAMKRLYDGSLLMLNKVKNTNNYYVLISTNNYDCLISDNKNTCFEQYSLSNNNMFGELTEKEYVAYVEDISEDYYVKIGDNIFYVLQEINL